MLDILRQNASSWIIKVLFAVLIAVFVLAFGMGDTGNNGDPVVAYVDDQPISVMEFQRAYQDTVEQMRRQNSALSAETLQSPGFRQMVLNQLITGQLIKNEAARLGVAVSDTEVRSQIATIQAFQNESKSFDPSIYEKVLTQNRRTPAQFEQEMRHNLLVQRMRSLIMEPAYATEQDARNLYNWIGERAVAEYVLFTPEMYITKVNLSDESLAAYYDKAKEMFRVPDMSSFEYISFTPSALAVKEDVTDAEVKAYYEAYKEKYSQDAQVKAQHILYKVEEGASEADVAAARKKAEKVVKMARKNGADFGKLAIKYSEGPSGPNGGELGWFGRGMMVKPFETAAFAMKKGEVSEPVRTRFGWHVIKLEDAKDAGTQPLEDVRDSIVKVLAEEKASDSISELLDEAIDRVAAGESISALAKSKGLLVMTTPPVSGNEFMNRFGMNKEAVDTLFAMAKGTTTKIPLAVRDGYMLAAKLDDQPSYIPEMKDIKERVTAAYTREEAERLAADAADVAARELAAGKTLDLDVQKTQAFSRQGFVSPLGMNQEFAQKIFASEPMKWIGGKFSFEQRGYVVARLVETELPDSKLYLGQAGMWIDTASRQAQQQLFTAFMSDMRENAKIEIVRQDIIN
ncbi:MAG: SurA N-terminal domain-containing protein [Desulfovibrio sp.]